MRYEDRHRMMASGLTGVLLSILLLARLPATIRAQTGGYRLGRWAVDGGGGIWAGEQYTVHGTIGQPEADRLSAGEYVLRGGVWGGLEAAYPVYLPLMPRE